MLSGCKQNKFINIVSISFCGMNNNSIMNNNGIVIYQSEDGKVYLDVVYNEDTLWIIQQF